MTTRICTHCKVEKPLTDYRRAGWDKVHGRHTVCKDCAIAMDAKYQKTKMFVNGKYIPRSHPLYKPGRYKTLDDAWSHCEIDSKSRDGEVYIIRNQAWPDWYKVGKAVSAEDRLSGYQTSSPFRDYVLCYSEQFDDRHNAESVIHRLLEKHPKCLERKGEWFKTYIPVIKEVMNEYRNQATDIGHRDEQCPQHDLALCNTGC